MTQPFDTLETPCVLVDIDRVEANLQKAQEHADRAGIALRPHIKTHKIPFLAQRQVALGAVGITVQKLGEAEVMADAGLTDIFLPYNILGAHKLARLRALNDRVKLAVTADSPDTVAGYAATFAEGTKALTVLVECDTGGGRCGVQTPAQALALARQIAMSPGLRFGGLMTYPAAGGYQTSELWLADAVALLDEGGLSCEVVTTGGTPDMWHNPQPVVTEYRPGTYIYFDRSQVDRGAATLEDCALTVLATVVSRPTATRVVLDSGSKALSSDLLGLTGHGAIVEYPDAAIRSLSEEHAVVDLPEPSDRPRVGELVRVVPNHACVVSNLFDRVHFVSGGKVVETVAVAARGRSD